MAITLNAVPGSGMNAYADKAWSDDYHTTLPYATQQIWEGLSIKDKERYLMWASRLLDESVKFMGTKNAPEQPMMWPRKNVPYGGVWTEDAETFMPEDSVPAFIKDAVSELARALIERDRTEGSDTRGIEELTAGAVKIKFDGAGSALFEDVLPNSVYLKIRNYGEYYPGLLAKSEANQSGGLGQISLVRGG